MTDHADQLRRLNDELLMTGHDYSDVLLDAANELARVAELESDNELQRVPCQRSSCPYYYTGGAAAGSCSAPNCKRWPAQYCGAPLALIRALIECKPHKSGYVRGK